MSHYFSHHELLQMDQRHRATFINSLGGFKSVNLVGTKNQQGQTNLAVFNSIVHLGANPALVGLIVRPDSVERHTYENIIATGFFTLNHLNKTIYEAAHQTSARYPREVSEFQATGLSEEYKEGFFAPFVKESFVQIGLEFKEKIELKINGTLLLISEINQVYLPEGVVAKDGFIDLEKAGSLTCSGLDSYHSTQKMKRLSYAKPNTMPKEFTP
ncbi:flavin oxidoreductase [Sphingobacteriaceae bacterium]|nr:flavin oxidoreductase [Sphingobacteriaceae bacterium]